MTGGNDAILSLLFLDGTADINQIGVLGYTALTYACRHGNIHVVNMLLSSQLIDVNSTDSTGNTPLHHAVMMKLQARINTQAEILSMLLNHNQINIYIDNKHGHNVLATSCLMRRPDLVTLIHNRFMFDELATVQIPIVCCTIICEYGLASLEEAKYIIHTVHV